MPLSLKSVEASRGARWINDALRLFARRPMAFTGLFAVYLLASLVVSLVPLLGGLAQMMSLPLLSLGFMIASQSALLDGPVHPRQFVDPLRADPARRRALLILCAAYGVGALLVLWLGNEMSGNAWGRLQQLMAKGDAAQAQVQAVLSEPGVLSGALMALALGTALTVPFWHAPALVHWGGQGVGQALFSSTMAVWRNKGAFLVYGATYFALLIGFGMATLLVLRAVGLEGLMGLLALPIGLVFSALFYVSLLFTFNDCFGGSPIITDDDVATQPGP